MKYAVISKFFDNGKVTVSGIIEVEDDVKDCEKVTSTYDYYFNVFDTREAARDYIEDCKNA